jgi:hypothetical protein
VDQAVKGDRVEVVIDAGGTSRTFELTATRAGRRVEVVTGRGVVQVMEVTRGGTAVRTARFMASRVIAVVEHPARDAGPDAAADGEPGGSGAGRRAARPETGGGRRPGAPAGAAAPGEAPPASMLDDAVERTASQLG